MKELDSRPSGLTERESAQRLERLGPNQLEPPRKPSVLARVLGQLKDPMILVLLGAAALSLAASGGAVSYTHLDVYKRQVLGDQRIPVRLGPAAGLPGDGRVL